MGSALIDRRTARFAVGLAVAGSLMLTAGLGIWAVSALSHAIPHSAHTMAWLAAVALITAGVCCGVLLIVLLLGSGGNGRSLAPAEPSWPDTRPRGRRPPGTRSPAAPTPGPPRPGQGWPAGPPARPRAEPPPQASPDVPPDPGLPPPAGQMLAGWPATAPERPIDPALGSWTPADARPGPDDGPELADWPDPPAAADHGDGYAAEHWSGPDAGLAPPAEPAADEWADPGLPPTERTAEDAEPDDGPVHRVESEFNVWQRPDPAASPDAGPAAPAPDEWVQPGADLPQADLLPDADLLPAAGLLPPAPELRAEPAEPVAEPLDFVDSQPDDELIHRPAAPRRSVPAPGWNPDSEEDWLRVLRGLRSSEDG